jgi:hypothetical protein
MRKAFPRTHPGAFVANRGGRPFAAALKGHVIIQCDPMGIAGLVLSEGFVSLLCVAVQHVNHSGHFVRRLPCIASIIHRIPMGFMHIGGSPILFSFPGVI